MVSKDMLKGETSMEIDLGSVKEIAEIIVNGENLGLLWKAPLRINIDKAVIEGDNTLEVRVSNLWPNRLIGDEQMPIDYERKGNRIKQWPDLLVNEKECQTKRTTFAACKHWEKDSELLPSGLLDQVRIIGCEEIHIITLLHRNLIAMDRGNVREVSYILKELLNE